MSSSLYELTGQAIELQLLLESGEITEEAYNDTIESLGFENKVESICKVIRNLEAEAAAFKVEKDRLAERQKTAENGIKRLKESLLNYMLATNKTKVKEGLFSVRVGSSEKVVVTNQDKIPKEYLIEQQPKVDIAGIKKSLKEGEEFEGIEIEENSFVVVR